MVRRGRPSERDMPPQVTFVASKVCDEESARILVQVDLVAIQVVERYACAVRHPLRLARQGPPREPSSPGTLECRCRWPAQTGVCRRLVLIVTNTVNTLTRIAMNSSPANRAFSRQPTVFAALMACQLGELNEVAASVIEHRDGRGGHLGGRHRELGAASREPLVVAFDVVGVEHGRGLALLEDPARLFNSPAAFSF